MLTPSELPDALARLAAEVAGLPPPAFRIQKLKGDASSRSYHRVSAPGVSFVAMVLPPDAKASEEASHGESPAELPFLDLQRYLGGLGVPVPRIHRADLAQGVLLLEDLGDDTLEAVLLREGEAARERLYGEAIDLLCELRCRADRDPKRDSVAFQRSFDFKLLRWEFDHYLEYGLRARTGRTLDPSQEALLARAGDSICQEIAALPQGFTHRDYQSRNLMVTPRGMVVIDFQDALLGPRQYDLVALLRDSYVELPEPFVDRMLVRYLEGLERRTGQREPFAPFRRIFDLVTVQRKLKDGGRFEYIDRVKGNPSFLPHVPASFRYVARALERLPEQAPLLALLAELHPEMA